MGCCWRNYCCHTDYFVCVRVIMRTRKRNLVNFVLAIAVPILYLSNNYFFKWHTSGFLHYLLVCHFNDFLASLLLLSFSNLLLETVNKEISSFPAVLLLCLLLIGLRIFDAPKLEIYGNLMWSGRSGSGACFKLCNKVSIISNSIENLFCMWFNESKQRHRRSGS